MTRLRLLALALLVPLVACPTAPPAPDDDDAADDDDAVDDDDSAPLDDDDAADDDDSAPLDDDDAGPPPTAEPTAVRSSLMPLDWTPATTDAEGRFLHDFSYAGYHRGEDPIPAVIPGARITPTGLDPTGGADSTAAIQAALDDAGQQGGGLVLLPPGTFRVSPPSGENAALRIRHSGVVLRGAGREATFLFNDDPEMRQKATIAVQPPSSASWTSTAGGDAVRLIADADERDITVVVADPGDLAVGDDVLIRGDSGDAWVAEHGMTGRWTTNTPGPTFHRTITAIDGGDVTLDIPLRYPVKVRDDARIQPALPHLSEVGIEDLSIGQARHRGSGWGDTDYTVSGTAAYAVHGADVIAVRYVTDGWIQRVGSYEPPDNAGFHMLSDGINVHQSRHITVRDAVFSHPQYEGGGGNGYSFVIGSSDSLFERCSAVSARHGISWRKSWTSGNVVLDASSSDPRLAVDFHMHLAMSNLVDGAVLDGDFIDATYRPYGTVEHGHTTAHSVLWNTTGLRGGDGNGRVIDSRQYDWGVVVGTRGDTWGVRTTPLIDTLDTAPEDLAERVGGAGALQPASLYRDQVSRRLDGGPAPTAVREDLLVTVPATEDTHVRGGSFAGDNYEGGETLAIKDAGDDYTRHGLLRFDLSALEHPVARAILLVEARVADQGGDFAELRAHPVHGSWDAGTVTFSTLPAIGGAASRAAVGPDLETRVLDVTDLVRGAGDDLSLALTQAMGGAGLNVSVRSVESGTPPTLELVLDDRAPLPVVEVTGDAPGDGTSLAGAVDGDLDTRWSNDTFGGSITLDLGVEAQVDRVDMAFYSGDQRVAFAELRTSVDGVDWTPARGLRSRGDSALTERFDLDPVVARWVRVVGLGNSVSPWNSYTEIAVYGE